MVAARKDLLKLVLQISIRDELQAMRLRGRLVVPQKPVQPVKPKA